MLLIVCLCLIPSNQNQPSSTMNYQKLDSLTLRRYLRALSNQCDEDLKKNGLNPEELRRSFYVRHNQRYELVPENHCTQCAVHPECDKYIIVDIKDVDEEYDSDDDYREGGERIEKYLFIGEKKDGEFITCILEYRIPIHHHRFEIGDWEIKDLRKADFISITASYGYLILDICDKWGFDSTIKWIKENN